MLNYEIISENNQSAMSVTLNLDMKDYLTFCFYLYHLEDTLCQQYDQNLSLQSKDKGDYVQENLDPSLKKKFKEAHEEIKSKIVEHSFDGYEQPIKHALLKLFDTTKPAEAIIAKNLFDPGNKVPMIQLFDVHFKELLKNSMDTMILRRIKGESTQTMLKLRISIPKPISLECVNLEISDNAGGFPESYITTFNKIIGDEKKRESETPTKRHQSEKVHGNYRKYCFGGEGAGMLALANQTVAISRDSSMTIDNVVNSDHSLGAKISLRVPCVEPVQSYKQAKYSSSSSSYGSPSPREFSERSLNESPRPKSPLIARSVFQSPSPPSPSSPATNASPYTTTKTESKKKPKPALTLEIKNPGKGPT